MQISGDIRLGEADSASSAIFARMAGPAGRVLQIAGCMGPALLAVVGIYLLDQAEGTSNSMSAIWIALCVAVIYLPFLIQFLARRAMRSARLARGATETTFCTLDLDDEGMQMDWDGARHWCAWSKVSEVILYRDMWVVITGIGYCLPRRLFGDQTEEAAFLDHVLTHLSPEAVTRSWDASFVRSGKAVAWTGYGKA